MSIQDIKKKQSSSRSLFKSKVLITGGTGTFGSAFLDKCLEEEADEIRIFSRDEKKQYDMAQHYKKYPNVKFYLGDVRDKSTIDAAMYGVDYVFHAAAMKQVPACENFPMEAMKTNIVGSNNVLTSAVQRRVKKVVVLSTDKAVYPTSAMGMTKAYMEKLALQRAAENSGTAVCITRFGNLVASRGSAGPLFIEQVQSGMPITITDPGMTRFMMTVGDAVDLVAEAFSIGENGDLLVKRSKACTIGDFANAVCRYMDLPDDYPKEIIGIRPGEKMHEMLLTHEEARKAVTCGNFIIVKQNPIDWHGALLPYESDKAERMNVDDVYRLIESVFGEGVV